MIMSIAYPAVILLAVLSAYSPGQTADEFSISGIVRADAGERMPNAILSLAVVSEGGEETRRFSAATNDDGFYLISFPLTLPFEQIELTVESHSADAFRYPLPDPVEISELVSGTIEQGENKLQYDIRIRSRIGWREQRQQIDYYGRESDKGKLIAIRGLPDNILNFNNGNNIKGELWFYYKAGIVIRFVNGVRNRDFYFKPDENRNAAQQ